MAAIKDTLLDKDGNEIYLKTVTDNVFDSEGNRLDNVIGSIKENLVAYSCMPNYSDYIGAHNLKNSNYTATQDCWVVGRLINTSANAQHRISIKINGRNTNMSHWYYGATYAASPFSLLLRKGDTIAINVESGECYSAEITIFGVAKPTN